MLAVWKIRKLKEVSATSKMMISMLTEVLEAMNHKPWKKTHAEKKWQG